MASTQTAPNVPQLAPAPCGEWWNDTQWAVLLSLLDAVLAPIAASGDARSSEPKAAKAPADGLEFERASVQQLPKSELDTAVARARNAMAKPPAEDLVAEYLVARASDDPQFLIVTRRTLLGVAPRTRKDLGGLLSILSGHVGSVLLTGYWTPCHQQPVHIRAAILRSWSQAWNPTLRQVARSLQAMAQISFAVSSPMFRQVSGFSDAPPNWQTRTVHDFEFVQFRQDSDSKSPAALETDVVIVGSGCGGAVCAQVLAAAGHRVVVVEKGYHFPPSQLPMTQDAGLRFLYENHGVLASTNPSISVLAGSCWGGGGTVNWSVCLRTPDRVRQEWAAKDQPGMAFITSPAFDESMDRVMDFMGINNKTQAASNNPEDHAEHSHRSRVILDGAAKLSFKAETLLQNTDGGKPHDDGYCHLGCATSEKRGPSVSWLPAAAKDGAQFIEGFHVERVLFDGDDGSAEGPLDDAVPQPPSEPSRKAVGVVGTWTSRDAYGGVAGPAAERTKTRVVIKAKTVIISCGSLWSPMMLLSSGLKNPQIGRNLHLHPCNFVVAFFDEETKPLEKGIITSICTSFEDLDGDYHGPRLESTCMVPYAALANVPWRSSLDFKLLAMRFRHMDAFISLLRDRDSGRVIRDPTTGQPVVDYTPSELDREHSVEGTIGIARLCHAAGANEIRAYVAGIDPYVRPVDATDSAKEEAQFEAWLRGVRAAALSASPLWGGWNVATPFASAHQMGTCRMGDDGGAASVVDPRGKVWGTQGLYVADASVFPSASGVNPMITAMALADRIAQGVAKELSG